MRCCVMPKRIGKRWIDWSGVCANALKDPDAADNFRAVLRTHAIILNVKLLDAAGEPVFAVNAAGEPTEIAKKGGEMFQAGASIAFLAELARAPRGIAGRGSPRARAQGRRRPHGGG